MTTSTCTARPRVVQVRVHDDLVRAQSARRFAVRERPHREPVGGARLGPHARIAAWLAAEEFVGADAEGGREGRQVIEREPAFAGFKAAEGRHVEARALGHLLEREPAFRAQRAQPQPHGLLDRGVGHPRGV